MQLREWQEQLQNYILYPHDKDKNIQLEIYSNAYVMRLTEALRTNYPAVHQLLGDEEFDAMARRYLDQYPSEHPSIRWFGHALATFFKIQSPYCDIAMFSELAEFEWALRHTIDAADADRLSAETLQAIASELWAGLCFALHPSVTVMTLQWNTPQLWTALTEGQEIPERQQQLMHWMVYRQADLVSAWRHVSSLEFSALQCLQQGGNFSDICEIVNDAPQAASLLRLWIEQGLISLQG